MKNSDELTIRLCKRLRQWGHIRWQLIYPEKLYRQRDQRQTVRETSGSEGLYRQMIRSLP